MTNTTDTNPADECEHGSEVLTSTAGEVSGLGCRCGLDPIPGDVRRLIAIDAARARTRLAIRDLRDRGAIR